VIPIAATLRKTPAMIWSARTEIVSQPWTTPRIAPTRTATPTPATRAAKLPIDSCSRNPVRYAANAVVSMIPSIPMLTTPDRSHMTPHRAPRASGAVKSMMISRALGLRKRISTR
jgi:hypothetical protein